MGLVNFGASLLEVNMIQTPAASNVHLSQFVLDNARKNPTESSNNYGMMPI